MAAPSRSTGARSASGSKWWNLLLVIPFIALLWVPFYNRLEPTLFGFPFFYWYQFAWVIVASALIFFVDVLTRGSETNGSDHP